MAMMMMGLYRADLHFQRSNVPLSFPQYFQPRW
jgi:hypothetical protein